MNLEEVRDASENLHRQTPAIHLGRLLDNVDAKTASEEEKNAVFQAAIKYRKIARQLPEETRSVIDHKVAKFTNGSFKKPAKKK
jgi:predicted transcriptional regulator